MVGPKDELDVDDASPGDESAKKCCCSLYDGNSDAKGYSWLGAGRGMISMANLFLNQSFLFLAYAAAGCELGSECRNRVYGFYPSSWVTNVPVIAGVLSAFLMPICGALVDFTPYRRAIGIATAAFLIAIQAIQIYTVESTWFGMMMLQAVAVAVYFLQLVAIFAYLPDIARQVGQATMSRFTSNFQSIQFGCQAVFLVTIVAVQLLARPSTVLTAQISQGLNTLTSTILFSVGWFKYIGPRSAVREVPEGQYMLSQGFRNNWKTVKSLQRHHKKGMRWFFLAVSFGQAAAQAIVSVSVVYLQGTLGLDATYTGIFFLVSLIISIPGCKLGGFVSQKTNPNISYKMSMVFFFIALTIGALVLHMLPFWCTFIWGASVGICLGWMYATEPLFFSMILPRGQEAELAGFYMYVSNIFAWLPPLVFTLMTEANVQQRYGVVATASFFLVATGVLMLSGTWEEFIEEAESGVVENAVVAESKPVEEVIRIEELKKSNKGEDHRETSV